MQFVISLVPVSKKNSQRIIMTPFGKGRILPSKKYMEYEKAALKLLPEVHATINYPVQVTYLFYMSTHRRVDLTNLMEALDDVLVKGRILDDDNCEIIVSHDGCRVFYDKENPRTEVTITRMQ